MFPSRAKRWLLPLFPSFTKSDSRRNFQSSLSCPLPSSSSSPSAPLQPLQAAPASAPTPLQSPTSSASTTSRCQCPLCAPSTPNAAPPPPPPALLLRQRLSAEPRRRRTANQAPRPPLSSFSACILYSHHHCHHHHHHTHPTNTSQPHRRASGQVLAQVNPPPPPLHHHHDQPLSVPKRPLPTRSITTTNGLGQPAFPLSQPSPPTPNFAPFFPTVTAQTSPRSYCGRTSNAPRAHSPVARICIGA